MKTLILLTGLFLIACTKEDPEERIKGWSRYENDDFQTVLSITINPFNDVDSVVLKKDGMTFRKTSSPGLHNDFIENVRLVDQSGHKYQFKVYSPSGVDSTRVF